MVHPCDKPCGNKTASGYCATTACINPQYSNIGTVHYGQGVQKRIITNADRIRAMTDEELAEYFTAEEYDGAPSFCCPVPHPCPPPKEATCLECWLDWLKEEAVSDG